MSEHDLEMAVDEAEAYKRLGGLTWAMVLDIAHDWHVDPHLLASCVQIEPE